MPDTPADFGLSFWTRILPTEGVLVWARHPTAGTLRETGATLDAALMALRARWALADADADA